MKKGLAMLLAAVMLLCFGGCKKENAAAVPPAEEPVVTVYLLTERVCGEEKAVYTYNEHGDKILEVDYWGQAENGRTTYTHTYNEKGYVTRTVYFHDDQKVNCPYIEYTYDANGNKTAEVSFTGAGTEDGRYEYSYNADGSLAQRIQYDSQGEEISCHTFTYDETGKLTQTDLSEGVWLEYEYDEAGKLLQQAYCYDDVAYSYTRYIYNSQGDLEKVSVISEMGNEEVLTYTKLSLSQVHANQLAAKTGSPNIIVIN